MYYGWIPNVSGYLSFTHIGGLPIRHRIVSEQIYPATRLQKGSEAVSILQERNLSDRPELGRIKIGTKNGRHLFLLQAKLGTSTAGKRCLEGVVISVPVSLGEYLHSAHAGFVEGRLAIDKSLADRYSTVLAHLKATTGGGHFCLAFTLADDGIIQFESLANAAPTDPNGSLLALEAYSFVKDLLHKHRFHSSADDALLELVEAKAITDLDWCHGVIRNLHRSIISSFRSASKLAQAHALGKLAYLESFFMVLKRRGLPIEPEISVGTLRDALGYLQAATKEEDERKNLFTSFVLSALAITIPLLFVSLQMLQIPCIHGINWTNECSRKFEVAEMMFGITGFVLKYLDYVLLAGILLFSAAVLGLWAKHLYGYNEARTAEGKWTGDLRDILLRIGISHTTTARLLLIAFGAGLVAAAGWVVWKLLG